MIAGHGQHTIGTLGDPIAERSMDSGAGILGLVAAQDDGVGFRTSPSADVENPVEARRGINARDAIADGRRQMKIGEVQDRRHIARSVCQSGSRLRSIVTQRRGLARARAAEGWRHDLSGPMAMLDRSL
jgi:hypothetical protein